MIVRDYITKKKVTKVTAYPQSTIADALALMARHQVGALFVLNEENHVIGVFSERDFARQKLLFGFSALHTTLEEVMQRRIIYATEEMPLEDCLTLMSYHKVRHLPVIRDRKFICMLSIEDVVEEILDAKEEQLAQLTQYVTGELTMERFTEKYKKPRYLQNVLSCA